MGVEPAASDHTDQDLEAGRLLFARECKFVMGSAKLSQLPFADLPEIAFAGRSNVGKSSLVNALTGRRTLARTSNTPGRTQQLNFFDLGGRLTLVDLPGYGYAKVSKSQVAAWTRTLKAFLRGRTTLRRACLLVDSRHGIKDLDREMMDMLDQAAVVYQLVLTKVDKLRKGELEGSVAAVATQLAKRPASYPRVALTSAENLIGVAELRADLAQLAAW